MNQRPLTIEQAEAALSKRTRDATAWDDSCEHAAADLATVMARLGASRGGIRRRLEELGVNHAGAGELASEACRDLRRREKDRLEAKFAGASPICPHCAEPLDPLDNFCPSCCGPVTALASMDPMGQIYSTGRAYRQALSGKPRLISLVAMWLIFGPTALAFLYAFGWEFLPGLLRGDEWGTGSFWNHAAAIGSLFLVSVLGILNVAILWKVTARYLRSHGPTAPEEPPPEGDEAHPL